MRRRRRDIRVQTENVGGSAVLSWGVRVQTDMTGLDIEKMEKRAYEGIRASRKKSKSGVELSKERLEVTITAEEIEGEVEVVMDGEEGMPELLSVEELKEIEEEFGEAELPVLLREVEGEPWREVELLEEVRVEDEECGLGEVEEIELGWEEVLAGDLKMTSGAFGELCEAVALVELEKCREMEEEDLLTGWVLPGAGSPDCCPSLF